jgi:DeoR family transcriptional regulator, glycerol-3-phosphate regulon repressor
MMRDSEPRGPNGAELAERLSAERRHEAIVALVQRRTFATIESLAKEFSVTVQTIRRDLNQLSAAGRLARYHGGAGLSSGAENIEYSARQALNLDAKERIARLVAAHIPAHSSLFINIGTTTEAVARALLQHEGLRVVTNNLNVAAILSRITSFEVRVTGGVVRSDGGLVGQAASEAIGQFSLDYGVIGISGIGADGTLLDFDYAEVRVTQAIIRNARQVLLVADQTKFGRHAMVRAGSIADVDTLFTDALPPHPLRKLLKKLDIAVRVAPVC